MIKPKIQTGIRFEEKLLQKITFIAKTSHRSFNAQMEFLAQQCIDEYEAKHGEITPEILKGERQE